MPYDNSDPVSNSPSPNTAGTTLNAMARRNEPRHVDGYQRLVRMRRLANGLLAAIMVLFVFSHLVDPPDGTKKFLSSIQ